MSKINREFIGIVYGSKIFRVTANGNTEYRAIRQNKTNVHFTKKDLNAVIDRSRQYDLVEHKTARFVMA